MRWPNGSQTRPSISSGFGPRPGGQGSSDHKGTDYTGIGQIRAIAPGRVIVVGTPSGWSAGGRQVWIQHDGFASRSMHMGGYSVSNGQWVEEAQIIGSEDTTGTATGSHLHLEIVVNGVQIDSVPFISARITGSPAGGSSTSTTQLQLDLTLCGYPLDADGQYGPATTAAVTQFQRDNGLQVDGEAGPQTFAKVAEVVGYIQGLLVKIGYNIAVDGVSGPATVGALKDFQGKKGLDQDGVVGPQTSAALHASASQPVGSNQTARSTADVQRLVGAEPDGIWGPDTTAKVMAWQSANGLAADGVWGPASDAKGFPPTPAAFIPVAVDGELGAETIRALQASLGFTGADIDGQMGPKTISALQAAVGAPVDGQMGPVTSRYLQAALGVRQDGQLGPESYRALQALLNDSRKLIPGKLDEVEEPTSYPKPEAPTFPGAARWAHSVNSSKREGKVTVFIPHHQGAEGLPKPEDMWNLFQRPNGNSVSPNWQVNSDGSIWEVVPPDDYRAWTTGQVDHQAITTETQNTTTGPRWGISPEALEANAQILAFGHKRYGIPLQRGKISGTPQNSVVEVAGIVPHNETPAGKVSGTICPGPSMDVEWIIARAKEIVNPNPEPPVDSITVPRAWMVNLGAELQSSADEVAKVLKD